MALAARRETAQGLALRARIVLACADWPVLRACRALRRFAEYRLDGLRDEPWSGAPQTVDDARVEATVVQTLESLSADAAHCSSRGMARASGLSVSTVLRIWRAFGLQPHRLEMFKPSTDPDFVAEARDVVGLYVAPPAHAIVPGVEPRGSPGVDEKSQVQALGRSQPMLALRPGQAARRTHNYKRHGTTSLFTAPDIATGRVVGKCHPRHLRRNTCFAAAAESRRFLDEIEATVPAGLDIHLVMGNYATHKAPLVRGWLVKPGLSHLG